MTKDENKLLAFDCEVFPNYWLVIFKNVATSKVARIDSINLEGVEKIKRILSKYTFFGWNSLHYDILILDAITKEYEPKALYNLSYKIIHENYTDYDTPLKYPNHFDIMKYVNGRIGLKTSGCRIHTETIQDIPIDPTDEISRDDRITVAEYCENDVDITIEMFNL